MSGADAMATGRLRLPGGRAPGGLCLVQELVNTGLKTPQAGTRLADLLAGAESADLWLRHALEHWAAATGQPVPQILLRPPDLAPLREFRETVRALATRGEAASAPDGHAPAPDRQLKLAVSLGPGGQVGYGPAGAGWRAVAALVTAEILLAQQRGQWPRFKACPFPACGVAFYDESRNVSRVWHDVSTCGNQTNVRAYRARRKEA